MDTLCGCSSVVERQLPKLNVVGSIPIARSRSERQAHERGSERGGGRSGAAGEPPGPDRDRCRRALPGRHRPSPVEPARRGRVQRDGAGCPGLVLLTP